MASVTCLAAPPVGLPEALEKKADTLFREFTMPGVPGASVAVVCDGKTVLAKGYGLANLHDGASADVNTNYRIASVTKQFTAMCVMMLKERGQLDYDDPIGRFFPSFPKIGQHLTVRHLLTHTSGVVAYEDIIPASQKKQLKDRDVLQLVSGQHGTYFTPGTQYRYSNTGYALLALIVERVSGRDFATFLKENIFQPLEMKASVAYERGISKISRRAYGYKDTDRGFVDADQSLTSAVLGDGGIYTSVHEYLLWDRALHEGRLAGRQALQEAFTAYRLPDGTSTDYGFGWRIDCRRSERVIYHDGGTSGFNAAVRRVPRHGITVVVFANRSGRQARAAADSLLDWLLVFSVRSSGARSRPHH